MAKTTARERRAAARQERRESAVAEPRVERRQDAPEEADAPDALRTAMSAALAAAAVGAARAFAQRRDGDDDSEPEGEEPLDEPSAVEEDDEEPVDDQTDYDDAPKRGSVHAGDAQRMVQRAREQLRSLHGADAESVSAVRRTDDGWRVGLEVVEVHRIPESTDVLATYEVELDDQGELVTFGRTARYHRSEADLR